VIIHCDEQRKHRLRPASSWSSTLEAVNQLCGFTAPVTLYDPDGAEVTSSSELEDTATVAARLGCGKRPSFAGSIFIDEMGLGLGRGRRCAVVGSSGARTSRPYGVEIDAHDVVVRLNENPAGDDPSLGSSMVDRIGRTTNLRVGAVMNEKNKEALLSGGLLGGGGHRSHAVVRYRWPWKPELESVARCKPTDEPCNTFTEAFLHHTVSVVSPGATLGNKLKTDAAGRTTSLKPSTGFLAVLAALYSCGEVNVYGFQLCRNDDERATPICQPQEDPSPQKYFCKYYQYGSGWHKDRCSRFDHAWVREHAALAHWNACGFLKVNT